MYNELTCSFLSFHFAGQNLFVHKSCQILLPSCTQQQRCKPCARFRSALFVRRSRHHKAIVADKTSISSSVRYSLLTKDEMKRRMKLLHGEIVIIKKQRDRLKERLQVKLETDAISLDPVSHGDMRQILQELLKLW